MQEKWCSKIDRIILSIKLDSYEESAGYVIRSCRVETEKN